MKTKLLVLTLVFVFASLSVNAALPGTSNIVASYSFDNADVSGATINDERNTYNLDGDLVGGFTTGHKGIVGQAVNGTGATSDGIGINNTNPIDNMFGNNYTVEFCYNGTD